MLPLLRQPVTSFKGDGVWGFSGQGPCRTPASTLCCARGIQNAHLLLKNLFPFYSLKYNCKLYNISLFIFSFGINGLIWGYFTSRMHQTRHHGTGYNTYAKQSQQHAVSRFCSLGDIWTKFAASKSSQSELNESPLPRLISLSSQKAPSNS